MTEAQRRKRKPVAGRWQNKSIDHPLCPIHGEPMDVSKTMTESRYFKCKVKGCKETSQREI